MTEGRARMTVDELLSAARSGLQRLCDEGYQSSLAAATLQQLGFQRATDVDGGFQAWRAAGLPVAPAGAVGTSSIEPKANVRSGQTAGKIVSASQGN